MSLPDLPPPSDQIRALMQLDKRVPELLALLSSALTSLLAPDPDAPARFNDDGSPEDPEERFVNVARTYYDEIDDIQLILRTTIAQLRLARALPTPADFIPPPPSLPPPAPFSTSLPNELSSSLLLGLDKMDRSSGKAEEREESNVGLNGLRMEVENLRQMRDALAAMKGLEVPSRPQTEAKAEPPDSDDDDMDEVS